MSQASIPILDIPFLFASKGFDLEVIGVVGVQRKKGGMGVLFEPNLGFSFVLKMVTLDGVPIELDALLPGGRIR